MEFSYEICDIGWAEAYIEINGSKDYFSVSYITNALKDLIEGIMSLIPECVREDEVKDQISFEWHSEPGGSIWNIKSINSGKLHIVIESYEDIYLKVGKRITLDEICDKTDFAKCITGELSSILKKYGLVGYRETWYEHDFPISAYLKVKNFLVTGQNFQVEHIERYPNNEYSKSELERELMLLGI